jgi:hypothetical protein
MPAPWRILPVMGSMLKGSKGATLIGWAAAPSLIEFLRQWTSTMRQWLCRISASSRRDCVLMGAAADRLDLVDPILKHLATGQARGGEIRSSVRAALIEWGMKALRATRLESCPASARRRVACAFDISTRARG